MRFRHRRRASHRELPLNLLSNAVKYSGTFTMWRSLLSSTRQLSTRVARPK